MGKDTSAAQKAKIARKSKAVRCKAVLPERKCVQAMKSTQPILGVSARALKQLGHISARQNRVCPCQLMVEQQYRRHLCTDRGGIFREQKNSPSRRMGCLVLAGSANFEAAEKAKVNNMF